MIPLLLLACLVQAPETLDVTAVGKDPRWQVAGRTTAVVDTDGKRALRMIEVAPLMGLVWLKDYDFANGTLEVDLLGRTQPLQGSFLGVAFHVADAQTYEVVYFRPFNFRATDSTRHSHAVEYVAQPAFPWQKLRSEHPGQYEAAVIPEPDGDQWFHVRVVVERPKVSVFVNGAATPALVVNELSDRTRGSVGLWAGDGSAGIFANLRVTRKP
ncbi:MAG TPA: family 16 glycoside hydrolase [Gemmatimonadales bacterium]|nr:family 16 glycoside hydrolase [Gemmatimonadales bacterium]